MLQFSPLHCVHLWRYSHACDSGVAQAIASLERVADAVDVILLILPSVSASTSRLAPCSHILIVFVAKLELLAVRSQPACWLQCGLSSCHPHCLLAEFWRRCIFIDRPKCLYMYASCHCKRITCIHVKVMPEATEVHVVCANMNVHKRGI